MNSALPEESRKKIESFIAAAMAEDHIPGLSLAAVRDNQIVYARGFGARTLKENLPATPDTLYGIGSCTKSFTALAVMQLAEQGKLDVSDPIKTYVPVFIEKDNPITIHHLLTHSSGIPNLGTAEILITRLAGEEQYYIPMGGLDDLFLYVNEAGKEVAAEPGKRFFYFNTGYTLLSEIVERVSGTNFKEYIMQAILKPLNMQRSTFSRDMFEKDSDCMTSYFVESEEGEIKAIPVTHPFHTLLSGPGGLLSSVTELANYIKALLNKGVYNDTAVVGASFLEEMFKPHVDRGINSIFGRAAYGYGWAVYDDFFGHTLVTHSGSTGMSSAQVSFVPDAGTGVAMACNMGGAPSMDLIQLGMLALLMGKNPEKDIPAFEIDKNLRTLTGTYETYKGICKIEIIKRGSVLYIESDQRFMEMSVPLIPESEPLEPFKFYIPGLVAQTPVEFVVDDSGIDLYIERNRFHKIKS